MDTDYIRFLAWLGATDLTEEEIALYERIVEDERETGKNICG